MQVKDPNSSSQNTEYYSFSLPSYDSLKDSLTAVKEGAYVLKEKIESTLSNKYREIKEGSQIELQVGLAALGVIGAVGLYVALTWPTIDSQVSDLISAQKDALLNAKKDFKIDGEDITIQANYFYTNDITPEVTEGTCSEGLLCRIGQYLPSSLLPQNLELKVLAHERTGSAHFWVKSTSLPSGDLKHSGHYVSNHRVYPSMLSYFFGSFVEGLKEAKFILDN